MEQFAIIIAVIISLAGGSYSIVLLSRLRKLFHLDYLNSLFYYKILSFVFGIYGILGSLAIGQILLKYELHQTQVESIMLAIPFFGIPFIIAAWYLLIKTGYELSGSLPSQLLSVIFFSLATISFLVYGYVLRNRTGNEGPEAVDINQAVRIVFYSLDLAVRLFICLVLISSALKSGKRSGRLFYFKLGILLPGLSVITSAALHFTYISNYIGLYFLIMFFCSDLTIIFLVKTYLTRNSEEFNEHKDSLEDLYQKYGISRREKEIIIEICKGKTNQEIADELFISLQTVKDHTYNIFRKVNVRNRVELSQVFVNRPE